MFNAQNFERLLQVIPHNQTFHSPVKGLVISHSDHPFSYDGVIQKPSICIVIRGEREIQLGEQCYLFDNRHFMFCPVNVPMCGKIRKATPENPSVIISMKIDLQAVNKILLEQTALFANSPENSTGFAQWHLDEELENAFERLLLLHENPNDITFLAPLIQQEIYYRLLTGEQSGKLKQMVSFGSNTQKIAKATEYLQAHYTENVTVDSLAELCGMSLSGFHSHFKKYTTLSPLQYQKSLRLMEAKRLIAEENLPVSTAAYQVGYESPSQFSREFKRYFGTTPSEK
ncbi:AraC family transcriptional regulator [Actinobacillus succinogenes]|uniref:AraC-type transcriptional regulator domain protein n=1 Tax=Actinobacillus succinogenes (strain ATCC 55618 / DSM 22257 / CCUG 43843 / 130Z) TaxID=339671 RepID=A6VPW5_ACTSZ|nr:AraC family transcriptional regulator [Actinobacillus succinogenes]ABR75012.1 AraC-type transcriptional regulator domain protein [Actinobacillus succinogenes 130Z]PHI40580.1 AraC family transcriptional regulator [Actinobacillus succinogenes]